LHIPVSVAWRVGNFGLLFFLYRLARVRRLSGFFLLPWLNWRSGALAALVFSLMLKRRLYPFYGGLFVLASLENATSLFFRTLAFLLRRRLGLTHHLLICASR